MHATSLLRQCSVLIGKVTPLDHLKARFSCLRPIMPLIQHLSAVGRVPLCNTAKLLSLRHLFPFTIFISLLCAYFPFSTSLANRPQKSRVHCLEILIISTINLRYLLSIQRHGRFGTPNSVSKGGHHACLWGLKEAVSLPRLGYSAELME
jgi:hypothetical protein